jgi:phosphoribosylformylglycinamidine synthase
MIAVAEAARNIVCSGGTPLGVTNCLNFGNPYDPEVYFQFVEAVKGMGAACVKFDTPVTGGNVSFYNQSPDGPVYPTPTIGMVGLLENAEDKMTLHFKNEGDQIFLLGHVKNDIGSSEYLHKIVGCEHSNAPYFNLDEEYQLHQLLLQLIQQKLIQSAHDVSEGGLMVALMESAFPGNNGFEASMGSDVRTDAFWFGEAQGRAIVSVAADKLDAFKAALSSHHVPHLHLGKVTSSEILINEKSWGTSISWKALYQNAISAVMSSGK